MPQVIANGGQFTGVSDANGNPVCRFAGAGAPPTWTGPVPNKLPASLGSVAGVTVYPAAGSELPLNIDLTNCGNGSEYLRTDGTTLATSRYVLVNGTWTGG